MPFVNQEVMLSKYLSFSRVQLEPDSHNPVLGTTAWIIINKKGNKTQAPRFLNIWVDSFVIKHKIDYHGQLCQKQQLSGDVL